MLCTAIIIQRKVGGNLADVLEKISETIQSRITLRKEIKTRTASGRMSGYIVGALPFLLLGAMSMLNPEYASALFMAIALIVCKIFNLGMLYLVAAMAGLGFDAELIRLYEKDKSELMTELMQATRDIQRGMSKKEAYEGLAKRCDVKELTTFLTTLVQAYVAKR